MRSVTGFLIMSPMARSNPRTILIVRNPRGELIETFATFDITKAREKYSKDSRATEIVEVKYIHGDRYETTLERYNWREPLDASWYRKRPIRRRIA